MRRFLILLALSPLLMAMSGSAPNLRMFANKPFTPGLWRLSPLDDDSRARMPKGRAMCILDPDALFHTGFDSADSRCGHTILTDEASHATLTYVCKGQGYGRASVRRAGDRYIVEAQGVAGREPFDMRGEYHRIADCATHR